MSAQDWGGIIGLTLPVDPTFRSTLDRLFIMNTVLPTGAPLSSYFYEWRELVRNAPDLPVGQWIRDTVPQLSDAEMAAYNAPFPDRRFQAGAKPSPTLQWLSLRWKEPRRPFNPPPAKRVRAPVLSCPRQELLQCLKADYGKPPFDVRKATASGLPGRMAK